MIYEAKDFASQPEILKRKTGGELTVPVTIHTSAFTAGVCKAGNPIDAQGKIANTASAVGILLKDVYAENPNGALVKAFATVNKANCNKNAGITLADAAIGALKNIVFE